MMGKRRPIRPSTISVLAGLMAAVTSCANPNDAALEPSLTSKPSTSTLPGLTIDHRNGIVELDATVNMREGGWLELLACTPTTRTHESILVVDAKPSHVHLAIQMLGLEPGAPMYWRYLDGEYELEPAHGPPIVVTVVYQQDGETIEVPANQWVINGQTHQSLAEPVWIFTGSSFDETQDPPSYRGDIEGSVLSLVHFGDEVLARQTTTTSQSDEGLLRPNTDQIPDIGTPVKIRLRPVE